MSRAKCADRVFGGRMVGGWPCQNNAIPGSKFCRVHTKREGEATISLWKTGWHDGLPERVMAQSISAKTFINERGRRELLVSRYGRHHLTEREALIYVRTSVENGIATLKRDLRDDEKTLRAINARIKIITTKESP